MRNESGLKIFEMSLSREIPAFFISIASEMIEGRGILKGSFFTKGKP
jgi:hypothetical protein